jgi:hypothetical protein
MATVAEVKDRLDAAGIDYPAGARKADLEQLLQADGAPVPVPVPTDAAEPAAAVGTDRAVTRAKQDATNIARIDAKIARLEQRREILRRRSLPAGVDPAGGRGRPSRGRKG